MMGDTIKKTAVDPNPITTLGWLLAAHMGTLSVLPHLIEVDDERQKKQPV